jgi:hypothetical protein
VVNPAPRGGLLFNIDVQGTQSGIAFYTAAPAGPGGRRLGPGFRPIGSNKEGHDAIAA